MKYKCAVKNINRTESLFFDMYKIYKLPWKIFLKVMSMSNIRHKRDKEIQYQMIL